MVDEPPQDKGGKLVLPDPKDLLWPDDEEGIKAGTVDLQASLDSLNADARKIVESDLSYAQAAIAANKDTAAALAATPAAQQLQGTLTELAKARADAESSIKALRSSVDVNELEAQLFKSDVAKAVLPPRVNAWISDQAELLHLDWGEVLNQLLRGGIAVLPSEPLVLTEQLTPPWPLTAAQGPLYAPVGAQADGSLSINLSTWEVSLDQESASVGSHITMPAGCTHVRLDSSIDGFWNVMATAILGYWSAELHVGVGIWDGSARLAFSETTLAADYAVAAALPGTSGSGTVSLSLDWDRVATPADQRLTVAVVMRANVGGAALIGNGFVFASVVVPGVQVQLAFG